MLPDVAGELLSLFRNFRPGLFSVGRGDQKSNAYSNSEPGGKTNNIPKGPVVIVAADGVGHLSDAICRDLVTVLPKVTKIVNSVANSLSHTFFGTLGLIQDEKAGSECYLEKLLHVHNSPMPGAENRATVRGRSAYTAVRRPLTRLKIRVTRASSNRMWMKPPNV